MFTVISIYEARIAQQNVYNINILYFYSFGSSTSSPGIVHEWTLQCVRAYLCYKYYGMQTLALLPLHEMNVEIFHYCVQNSLPLDCNQSSCSPFVSSSSFYGFVYTLYIYIYIYLYVFFFFFFFTVALRPNAGHDHLILEVSRSHTTFGRTPLDEWSAHHRDLYLTTHNTHNSQTSMHPVGFEPTISASKRPQTYAVDRAATGTGTYMYIGTPNALQPQD